MGLSLKSFLLKKKFTFHLFLAVLGLHCCAGLSLVAASGGYSIAVVCKLLITVASLVTEHGLYRVRASVVAACGLSSYRSRAPEHRLNSLGARAQLLHSMWDLPGPGIKPMSPALAGRFFTTEPSGKPLSLKSQVMCNSGVSWIIKSNIMPKYLMK